MRLKLKPIKEQVVVVFGASSGIGRQAALDFARKGARVVVAARSKEGLTSLVEEIHQIKQDTQNGSEALMVVAEAADFESVKSVADAAVEKYGRLDTWVHAAAVMLFAKFEGTTPEEFRHVIEVNLLGQVHGAMAALPYLRERGGALIHISSVEAWRAVPFQSAYGASKHGTKGFLQALRVELAHDKIPVSVTEIEPGAINTPIYDKALNKLTYKLRPVPPVYQPEIVSEAILYAAENPVRNLIAGAAGVGVVLSERLSPRLTDWITETVGFKGQNSGIVKPENDPDAFSAPHEPYNTIRGKYDSESLNFDPYTFLATRPAARNAILAIAGALVGGLAARSFINACVDKKENKKVKNARLSKLS